MAYWPTDHSLKDDLLIYSKEVAVDKVALISVGSTDPPVTRCRRSK